MTTIELFEIADALTALIKAHDRDAKVLLVGGCVRDMYAGHDVFKDADIEVFGIPNETLIQILKTKYELDEVGKTFSVIKLKGLPVDISLPRREVCTGPLHTDFVVTPDHTMTVEEAALRRDFTINAIYYDTYNDMLVDPHGGRKDLDAKILRPVSHQFEEDAVRVLRAAQFIARFDLEPTFDLVQRCRNLLPKVKLLSKERVLEEWKKLLLKGKHIDKGLEFLWQCNVVQECHPELAAIRGVEQSPEHHPEGDVWVHTCHCLNHLSKVLTGDEESDTAVAFAVLGHDFGKATCTKKDENGRITAYGHEAESGPLMRKFMERMFNENQDIIPLVEKLVVNHMRPVAIYNSGASLPALRRCSVAVDGRLDLLLALVECDQSGRPPQEPNMTANDWVKRIISEQALKPASKIQPIIMGRHLIEHFKLQPGPQFKPLLEYAFEGQLDGLFVDVEGGLEYVRKKLA
jgi:tRNA nucleotidyltransferase (CCA-adding enzyme)